MWDAFDPAVMLSAELAERKEAGYDVDDVEPDVRSALEGADHDAVERVHRLLEATEIRAGWPFDEPSSLERILHGLPDDAPVAAPLTLDDHAVRDRILAGWLGRCAGCNLGKPVEGWSRARIRRYLELAGAYPITDYLPVIETTDGDLTLNSCWPETTRGNVTCMARRRHRLHDPRPACRGVARA